MKVLKGQSKAVLATCLPRFQQNVEIKICWT